MLRGRHAAATPRTRPVMRPWQREPAWTASARHGSPTMPATTEHTTRRTTALQRLSLVRLYVITAAEDPYERVLETVRAACDGGAEVVQLRRKGEDGLHTLRLAERCRRLTARAGALLIVNDRLD